MQEAGGGVGPGGAKAETPVAGLMEPPHVSPGETDQVASGPSGSIEVGRYVYSCASVAVEGGTLVMEMDGLSLTGMMFTVADWVAQRLGEPSSQTFTARSQEAGGGARP